MVSQEESYKLVRGMRDVLPGEQADWRWLGETFERVARQAGFGRIDTPMLEEARLFMRGVGQDTEVVSKELYSFTDKSDNELALRPEGTASVARAYLEHGMGSWPQPVRLYYTGPMFRYDRPQAGRQRQFTTYAVELFGEAEAEADATVINLALRFFRSLGLNPSLQINSIGDTADRNKYRAALVDYFGARRANLSELAREQLERNPVRILDSKDPGMADIIQGAPDTLNFLGKESQAHLRRVLEYLDEVGVAYELNSRLVRGLDYYNRTVFEFWGGHEGAQNAIGGGGRYDGLIETLGGAATPAVGFGLGVERIMLELERAERHAPETKDVKVYVVNLGDKASKLTLGLTEQLLDAGVGAVSSPAKANIRGQLEKADKLSAPYALIIGQKEAMDGTAILRDMQSGAQEILPQKNVVTELQRRLA